MIPPEVLLFGQSDYWLMIAYLLLERQLTRTFTPAPNGFEYQLEQTIRRILSYAST